MAWFLGIDTSNYTTSVALYDDTKGQIHQNKQLLPVKDGAVGLRQSDAVFSHVKQLGELMERLLEHVGHVSIAAVGVSARPRDMEGSYMPCFLVGEMAAQTAASLLGIPLFRFSHQAGHIAAALFSAGQLALKDAPFAAFHLSGGTTDALLVKPDRAHVFQIEPFAASLDLKAGQAVDRVGAMLDLPFPAGPALEKLALESEKTYHVKPTMKGKDCSLSGIENRCRRMLDEGEPKSGVARFCIDSILSALSEMTVQVKKEHGDLPVVYSGGVMSNRIIREAIVKKHGGYFAEPAFSADNAAGIAVLTSIIGKGDMP